MIEFYSFGISPNEDISNLFRIYSFFDHDNVKSKISKILDSVNPVLKKIPVFVSKLFLSGFA